MLAAFRRLATIDRTLPRRELLAYSMLGDFMQSDKSFDVATCMYYTGLDPFTKKPVHVARGLHDRKLQRALMQFFKPSNYFEVRAALLQAGRADLIGNGCDCLIPAQPPKEALDKRRKQANDAVRGDHYHAVANPSQGEKPGERGAEPPKTGYRPGRKSQLRQQGKKKRKGSGPQT